MTFITSNAPQTNDAIALAKNAVVLQDNGLADEKQTLSPKQQKYVDAVDSVLGIIFYYEDDDYEVLMEESAICDLTDNFEYSIDDARSIMNTALEIHNYRHLSGFYN